MTEPVTHTTIADELAAGKSILYFTVGASMKPLLTERKTHVRIAPIGTVRPGDILLYIRENGVYVLHRCIKQDSSCYYMRGDNTYGFERIEHSRAIGCVTHIYRKGKWTDVQSNTRYRAYVAIWNFLYPFRLCWHTLKRVLRAVLQKLRQPST